MTSSMQFLILNVLPTWTGCHFSLSNLYLLIPFLWPGGSLLFGCELPEPQEVTITWVCALNTPAMWNGFTPVSYIVVFKEAAKWTWNKVPPVKLWWVASIKFKWDTRGGNMMKHKLELIQARLKVEESIFASVIPKGCIGYYARFAL